MSIHESGDTARRDIVVIGASAGGPDAIVDLVCALPPDIGATIFVVLHLMPDAENQLADILNMEGELPAKTARDGEETKPGVVYVAPADRHLIVKPGYMRVTRGPRENRWRPAIDPLFRSAAVAYGNRAIGVVLSGMLDDGTSGLMAIKRCNGIAIVQDPDDAAFPEMPRTALANVAVDYTLSLRDMALTIARLVREPVPAPAPIPDDIALEARIAESGYSETNLAARTGDLTPLSCPECSGPLWRDDTGSLPRYRCAVGHAYAEGSLLSAQAEALESSLWAAVRLFEQRANVLNTMADKERAASRARMEKHHSGLAEEARRHAELLRKLLMSRHE